MSRGARRQSLPLRCLRQLLERCDAGRARSDIHMTYKLLGKNFTPHDVMAKVTGQAKYAEDFRVDGMVFCRLLTSPIPHARVRSIDTREALKIPGVVGILTADDITNPPPPQPTILTNEPRYVGEPILAVAAVDETTAQDAIEKIKLD